MSPTVVAVHSTNDTIARVVDECRVREQVAFEHPVDRVIRVVQELLHAAMPFVASSQTVVRASASAATASRWSSSMSWVSSSSA